MVMKAYLEKLIKVLNDDDLNKIKSIQIKTSKLKIYLNYLLTIREEDEMSKVALQKYLRVDDKMLRKMKSVLLRKCYDVLSVKDGLELLNLLSRYRLVENFRRELLLQEGEIKKQKNIEITRRFYEAANIYLLRLPFSTLSTDELNQYSKLNLEYSKDNEKELQALFHSGRILVIRMIQTFYSRDINKPEKNSFIDVLKELEAGSEKFKDESLVAMTIFCKALYAYWVEEDFFKAKKLFSNLLEDIQLLKLLPEDFADSINGFYATILFKLNEFDLAIKAFEKYVTVKHPFFYNQPHLLSRLCELYMIVGRMDEAKLILDKHLKRFLESGETDAIQLTAIAFAKYYMLSGDLTNAFDYLQKAREYLNKKFYLINDIEIRTLELIYFILSGDIKFSKAILARTLKFLREKVKTKKLQNQIEKQELLNKMCWARSRNKPMGIFTDRIQNTFNGFDTIYALLLKKYCLIQNGIAE